jgi:hypothetical protein
MAYSNAEIVAFLIANPQLTDAQLADIMETAGVDVSQVAEATGSKVEDIQGRFETRADEVYVPPAVEEVAAPVYEEPAAPVAPPLAEPVAGLLDLPTVAPVDEPPVAPVVETVAAPIAPPAAPTGQISTQQIVDFLATNPTNAEIGKAMETFKVSPTQIADALASQEAKLGATTTVVENAETGQTSLVLNDLGGGFNAYRDEDGNLSYSRVDPANPDKIQLYGPKGEYRQQTTPAGSFPANAWGLQDMHGNVLEWCLDHWHGSYEGAPIDGSAWLNKSADASDMSRLLRGGSWDGYPGDCRSACRTLGRPVFADFSVGFRVVCLPQGPSLNP